MVGRYVSHAAQMILRSSPIPIYMPAPIGAGEIERDREHALELEEKKSGAVRVRGVLSMNRRSTGRNTYQFTFLFFSGLASVAAACRSDRVTAMSTYVISRVGVDCRYHIGSTQRLPSCALASGGLCERRRRHRHGNPSTPFAGYI